MAEEDNYFLLHDAHTNEIDQVIIFIIYGCCSLEQLAVKCRERKSVN